MRSSQPTSAVLIQVGAGELLDKITILEIKQARITDPAKRDNVLTELAMLNDVSSRHDLGHGALAALQHELKATNADLWTIEDRLRDHEARGDFGAEFVALARAVYQTNDRRAALKKKINTIAGSAFVEEKSYGS